MKRHVSLASSHVTIAKTVVRSIHRQREQLPHCAMNPMRVIAVVDGDPRVVEKILRHLGAGHDPPPRPPPGGKADCSKTETLTLLTLFGPGYCVTTR
jgi:hypothetical protein